MSKFWKTVLLTAAATGVAAVVMVALMIGFFAVVVLPRSRIQRGRRPAVRRDWTAAAATYVLVLAPLVALAPV
mgnify:CR=1 FL=1